MENESENGIFHMYGLDGTGHAPSQYTKYYRAWHRKKQTNRSTMKNALYLMGSTYRLTHGL